MFLRCSVLVTITENNVNLNNFSLQKYETKQENKENLPE